MQIYIGEISSSRLRGLFGTIMQLFITLGVFMGYGLSVFLPYYHVSLAAAVIITGFIPLGLWLKETPRWLLANKQAQPAFFALKWLRGPHYDIGSELETMKLSLTESNESGVWREFKRKSVLVPFVTLLLVFFFQQIGGLNAQAAYATVIFKDAGVNHPQLASAMCGGVSGLVGNVIAGVLVDKMGRKPLLFVSGIGMGIGSTLLGVHFYITRPSLCSGNGMEFSGVGAGDDTLCNRQYGPLAIVSLITYNFLFGIGWASVPWVLLPELLPLKVRGIGGGFAVLINWATSALVTGTYLSYVKAVTVWFGWWSFGLLNFMSVAFAAFALVETKGKSLESIQAAFEKKWSM
jgi:MFS family permease